jgi:hypothetical protein
VITIVIIFVPNRTLFSPRNVKYSWYDSYSNICFPLVALSCLVAISRQGPDDLIVLHILPSQANAGEVIFFR